MLGVGIILPNGRRRALVQRLPECGIGLHAGDVIVAGLDDVNGATDIGRERDRILLLVGKPGVFDRWIGGGAGLDPLVLRRGHQDVAAAEAEAEHADRAESQIARHVVDPLFDLGVHPAVAELARARLRFFVIRRQGQPFVMVPHRGGEPGAGERFRVAADECVDAEDRRQDDDAAPRGRVGLREKAEQAGLLDVLRLGRHGSPLCVLVISSGGLIPPPWTLQAQR